ncbi:MAG: hypothetical protein P1V20_27245 [Verrucomicrobiales bacterium]|nr:hypothetical protein [Verrucomicrobiales bacterium]
MNSLTLGFLYVLGISWALAETCIIASNGNWTPLIIFLIGFILMFSILGCAKISDAAVERWGGIFAMLLAVGLVFLTFSTAMTGAVGLAVIKGIFALGFVVVGLVAMIPSAKGAHQD